MNTMKAVTASAITAISRMNAVDSAPSRLSWSAPTSAPGSSATMPAMMISEMPLPMPRDVICSPSHIRNMVPPVSVMTVEIRKNQPGSLTTLVAPSRPMAMPNACSAASPSVR